jgi:hypothetical protein
MVVSGQAVRYALRSFSLILLQNSPAHSALARELQSLCRLIHHLIFIHYQHGRAYTHKHQLDEATNKVRQTYTIIQYHCVSHS